MALAPLALLWMGAGVLLALWTTHHSPSPPDNTPPDDRALFDYLPLPALLESLPDGYGRITILDCNQATCRQLGYAREELIGQPLSMLNTEMIDQARAVATLMRLRRGEIVTLEATQRRKDGTILPVYVSLRLVPFARGEAVLSQQVDITLAKRVEEQLRFQASLLDAVNESVVTTDLAGRLTFWSRGSQELYGWTAEEVLGRSVFEVVGLEPQPTNVPELMAWLSTAPTWSKEFLHHRRDGTPFVAWVSGRPLHDQHGTPIGTIGVARDITERKRLAEQLAQRECEFRTLVENIPDVIARFDREHRHMYISPTITQLSGQPPMTYLGRSLHDLHFPQDIADRWARSMDYVFASGEGVVLQEQAETIFGLRSYEVRLVPEFGPDGEVATVLEISHDNTDQVQLEEALRQLNGELERRVAQRTTELQQTITELEAAHQALRASEERYRRIVETVVEGIWMIDAHARTTFVNKQMAEMLGTTIEWIQGRSLMEFVPPSHRQHVERSIEERKQGRAERLESVVVRPDGTLLPVYVSTNPLFDTHGTYQGALVLVTDISQRKRSERDLQHAYTQLAALSDSLRQSRNLLRTVVDGLSEGVALLDEHGRVLVANRALANLLHLQVDGVIGLDWEAISGQFAQVIPAAWVLQKVARSGSEGLFRVEGADGQMQMVAVYMQQLQGAPEQRVVIINDVTERMQIEAQAIEQERFAANGKLAAVVAHEVNTPLQAIENCLFLAEHAEGQRRDMYIEIAQQEIHRIGEMMHQLLDLYRPTSSDVQQVDLNELVKRLLILVQYHIQQQQVALTTEFASTLPSVRGRADELSQVTLNLMMNALQAMPNGGTLAISTRVVAEHTSPAESTSAGSCYVVLRVTDTGPGIAPELHARIFEPFFTTKANGSGLGLAVSQKIMADLGGGISVTSAPRQGSSFEVWLPAAGQVHHNLYE